MSVAWAITPEKVHSAVQRILEVSKPKKIILFGSFIRGKVNVHSDLDVLIVTGDEVENSRKESVRIRRALKGISMPMDILVITETKFKELADQPGLIYREIVKYGEVVYDAA